MEKSTSRRYVLIITGIILMSGLLVGALKKKQKIYDTYLELKTLYRLDHFKAEVLDYAKVQDNLYSDTKRLFENKLSQDEDYYISPPEIDFSDPSCGYEFVYIMGHPRSGTTQLLLMLSGNKIESTPLTAALTHMFIQLPRYFPGENLSLYSSFLGNNSNAFRIYQKYYYSLLQTFIERNNIEPPTVILKDPNLDFTFSANFLPLVMGGNFKILFIVRDPRDAIASQLVVEKRLGFKYSTPHFLQIVKNYYKILHRIHGQELITNEDRFYTLRYEDFSTGDPQVISKVERFVGKALITDNQRDQVNSEHAHTTELLGNPLSPESVHKYKKTLTQNQIKIIENIFAEYLHMYRYKEEKT